MNWGGWKQESRRENVYSYDKDINLDSLCIWLSDPMDCANQLSGLPKDHRTDITEGKYARLMHGVLIGPRVPHGLHSLEQNHHGQYANDLFISWPSIPIQGQEPSESRKRASISDLPQPCQVSLEQTPFSCVSSGIRGFRILDAGLGHFSPCISHGKWGDWLTIEYT